jgi:hypothetical protein
MHLFFFIFFASFHVSGETIVATYMVTKETMFYAVRPTKNLNLKCRFCITVFTCFLTEFRKYFP